MVSVMLKRAVVVLGLSLMLVSCGYHPVKTGSSLPPYIKTIAIPTFRNSSLSYRVEQRFTLAVMEEMLRRGRRLDVTSNPEGADAVLTGDIRRFRTQGLAGNHYRGCDSAGYEDSQDYL